MQKKEIEEQLVQVKAQLADIRDAVASPDAHILELANAIDGLTRAVFLLAESTPEIDDTPFTVP